MSDKDADTSVPVHELIARRWSPRAFDAEATVDPSRVRALLEAARWAPSCGNSQPARYLVGMRGDDTFRGILGALTERNQSWAHRASVLMVACARMRNEKGDVPYPEYGVGLSTENLALQAVADGLAVHQMAGFDRDTVRREFALPDGFEPLAAIAVGVATDADVLADDRDISRETAPRERLPLAEFAFTDTWDTPVFPS
ncbi:nitroreductase family protein [Saccharomonospora iraqiensis]|uniref:nitroreductase family protein n=1 Tax=Saccharomonospora iraqiensis TaxID=52698 RepID=UPI00022E6E6D|nr:nitroreductase family protein [Saccharomonospora iraqiensis]